jgi:hypothetical protein
VIMAANDGERKAARPSASPAFCLDLAAVSAGHGGFVFVDKAPDCCGAPPSSVVVLHGLFPLVVVLLIGIVLYISFAIAFDAIRKAMWRHKHRAALSDWATTLGGTTTMNRPRRGSAGTAIGM